MRRRVHADAGGLEPDPSLGSELVAAEEAVERRLAGEPRQLDRGDAAAAGRLLPGLLRADDLAGTRNRLDPEELDPLDVPDDGDLHNANSHRCRPSRVTGDDGSRGHDPSVRAFLRRAPRRRPRLPPQANGRAGGRGRLPGDVPARASRLRPARARRAPARVGADDRRPARDRHEPARTPDGARAAGAARRGRASRLRADRAPRRRPAAHRARRARAPLRLRPFLRRHRRRTRLHARGRPPGRLVRSPTPARARTGRIHDRLA